MVEGWCVVKAPEAMAPCLYFVVVFGHARMGVANCVFVVSPANTEEMLHAWANGPSILITTACG